MAFAAYQKKGDVESILVIHQGALGDFILALPCLRILRVTFPEARTAIMGYPRILELVEKRFYAEEVLSIDQKGVGSFFVRGGSLDPGLSQFFGTFDLIVVFGKIDQGTFIGNLGRVSRGQIVQINPFPNANERVHLTDHLLSEFSRQKFSGLKSYPRLYLNESDRARGKRFWKRQALLPEEQSKVIVIHPGSGSKKKVWPLERFLELVEYLQRHHARMMIVLGPAEAGETEKRFDQMEWSMGTKAPVLAKGLSLLELASVMEGCRYFIGNDSGVTHMAAALGLPVIALFGPTDPKIWAPRGKRGVVIRKEMSCSPCSQEKFFLCRQPDCLREIRLEDVLQGMKTLELSMSTSGKEKRDGREENR